MSGMKLHREEIANALTHGIGVILSIGGGAVLITLASVYAGAREIVSAAVFSAALVLLYTASTLYHAVRHPRLKSHLKVLDHCAIFLMIAATYTPFTVAAIRGGWGWSLFGVVWGLAVFGIVFKVFFTGRFKALSTATYIGMGWLIVVAFAPLSQALTPTALTLLILGGVFFTAGTIFYHFERIPYSHAIWHLFVLAGSICHFGAVTAQLLSNAG
ncbi:PAQR family membrane homeostasis protein TrhA [Wenzhouxiangella marina]|nr:hemolysin III family protein [Wenzhouxiangella marina]MBB6085597.1 hemolysin III [Wenzhouxiangella marina]